MHGRSFLASAALCALLLGSTSCGGGDEPKGPGGKSALGSAESKKLRSDMEKDIDTIAKALVKAPLDYKSTVANCEKYATRSKEAGFKDLAEKCEKMKSDAKGAYEAAAEKELKDAAEKVHGYVEAGEMDKARSRAKGIAGALWKDEKYLPRIDEIQADLKRAERAEAYFQKITRARVDDWKGKSEFERATGVCQAFLAIPAFSSSPRRKDVEKMVAELAPEVAKAKEAKAKDAGIKPLPAYTGDEKEVNKYWDLTDPSTVKVADKIITFSGNSEESPSVSMRCGAEDWEDYQLEITFRVLEGEAYVSAHGTAATEDDRKVWTFKPGAGLSSSEYGDKGRWYLLKMDVRGKELTYTVTGSGSPVTKKTAGDKGPFEIRIPKPGGVIQIKSVWAKVIKPEGAKLPE